MIVLIKTSRLFAIYDAVKLNVSNIVKKEKTKLIMTLTIVDYCRLWSETLQKFISVRKWLSRLTASSGKTFFVRVVQ